MEVENQNKKMLDHISIEEAKIYYFIKRITDILLSITALLLLIPLYLIIMLIIKLDDPKGPVFFQQIRVGKNGKLFKMYKFRTMYIDAEERLENLLRYNEIEGAMFKLHNDPRITKIGKVIRSLSIDEFPQLINVLKGEMSIVGPRPPLIREVENYSTYDLQRLIVTPGITGLWQISGRNSLSFKEMVELDLMYIRNISLKNDLKIILKTVVVVIKRENAY